MIKVQCSHCRVSMDAPDAYVGRHVKCPKCGGRFKVEQLSGQAESLSGFRDAHSELMETSRYSGNVDAPGRPAEALLPETLRVPDQQRAPDDVNVLRRFFDQPVDNDRFSDHSDQRYPNLLRYLNWSRTIARFELLLMLALAGLCLIYGMCLMIEHLVYERFDPGRFVSDLTIPTLFAMLPAIVGYVVYVIAMAGIELVHVVIDIERNTRRELPSEPH